MFRDSRFTFNSIFALAACILVAVCASVSDASFYHFDCPDRTEVEIFDRIDGTWSDALRFNPTNPVLLRVRSPGGGVSSEETAVTQLEILANQVDDANLGPVRVIVTDSCASACTIFLAALNSLAAQNKIHLEVANDLQLGFHAASDGISGGILPSSLSNSYYLKYGVSSGWLAKNQSVFSQANVKWVLPNDAWFIGSGFLTNAQIISNEISDGPMPSSSSCTAGPVE